MTEVRRILIVEDEEKLAQVEQDYLLNAGFATDILTEGDAVVSWVKQHFPDLILLDLMLPGRDGLSICREIRTFSSIPIIMITARVEEIDRLLGLEMGLTIIFASLLVLEKWLQESKQYYVDYTQ